MPGATSDRSPVAVIVHGTGRMGRAICDAAAGRDEVSIEALVGPQAPDWDTAIPWHGDFAGVADKPDLVIDFTLPAGTSSAAHYAAATAVPLLSGVTGLGDEVMAALRQAADRAPVLWSPNLSLGVNLLADLAGRAAAVLDADTPVLIEDIHHQWKKDAPSGTALMLGRVIADQRNGKDGGIEYASVREGEEIGVHTVTFRMAGEEFDLVHRAHDRSIYALGALDAGLWLCAQPAGLYTARDWLASR